ncbi:integrase core domain-containing protein, partial [Candidatus Poribacteria bacterium]|nr:integrase core domain-containing protein [Candidatus Poribacteria bacterium]
AERLIRTLKEEEVYLNEYEDIQEARERIGYFLEEVYMKKRVHSALGYLTPLEFEQSCNPTDSILPALWFLAVHLGWFRADAGCPIPGHATQSFQSGFGHHHRRLVRRLPHAHLRRQWYLHDLASADYRRRRLFR